MVSENEYTGKAVNIPHPLEIPNVDLQVMNYHRPMLGTFHSKFMVVDRKIAVVSSNNIQSNDNCEMENCVPLPRIATAKVMRLPNSLERAGSVGSGSRWRFAISCFSMAQ